MTFGSSRRVPRTPTMPHGELVATYDSYLEAQRAVDHLADKDFPVQHVTIVGADLRMVERVTGRLSYPRVAFAGSATGAWFGLFVGVLLYFFSPEQQGQTILAAILIGAAFGMLFSVITYSLARGRRDFTSASQIVAATYAVLCHPEKAHRARALLAEVGAVASGRFVQDAPARPATPPPTTATPLTTAPAPPTQPGPPPASAPSPAMTDDDDPEGPPPSER